ncbi:MAG: hypothetical protein AAGD38_01100 [Acidobacteriota bacterium]
MSNVAMQSLEDAWRDRTDSADEPPVPAETVWDAVTGKLPLAERRRLIDRMVRDPQLAEEWRLAMAVAGSATEVSGSIDHDTPSRRTGGKLLSWPRRGGVLAGLAAAAMVMIAILLPYDSSDTVVYRGDDVVAAVDAGEPIDRNDAVLRWRGPEEAARYEVVVTSLLLDEIYRARELTGNEVRIPAEAFADVEDAILWQVIVYDEEGSVIGRPTTFRTPVLDVEW